MTNASHAHSDDRRRDARQALGTREPGTKPTHLTGTNSAKTAAPANAPVHMHIATGALRNQSAAGPEPEERNGVGRLPQGTARHGSCGDVAQLRDRQQRHPRALKQLGAARAVSRSRPTITDAELRPSPMAAFAASAFARRRNAVVTGTWSSRCSPRERAGGRAVQCRWLTSYACRLPRRLSQMVFDHLGHPELPAG
jgi:hypothetical protein